MKVKKFLRTSLAVVAASALCVGNAAAGNYSVDFTSSIPAYSFIGTLTTDLANQIIGMNVTVAGVGGGAVTSVATNGSFPVAITSLDGAWVFDNKFNSTAPYASDNGGWLFSTATGEFNLWNTVPTWGIGTGPYTLGVALNGVDTGTYYRGDMTIAAVPEPETFAMLLSGLGLIGMIGRRRRISAANA